MIRSNDKHILALSYIVKATYTTRFILSRFISVSSKARMSQIISLLKKKKFITETKIGVLNVIFATKIGYDLIQSIKPDSYGKLVSSSNLINKTLSHNVLVQYCLTCLGDFENIKTYYFDTVMNPMSKTLSVFRPDLHIYFTDDAKKSLILEVELARGKSINRIYKRVYDCYLNAKNINGISFIIFPEKTLFYRYSKLLDVDKLPIYDYVDNGKTLIDTLEKIDLSYINKYVHLFYMIDFDKKDVNFQRIK